MPATIYGDIERDFGSYLKITLDCGCVLFYVPSPRTRKPPSTYNLFIAQLAQEGHEACQATPLLLNYSESYILAPTSTLTVPATATRA